ncbi:class II D-tagatose-bisphosphate aldolase non-catalytic subunit, partial [Klebsiella variicola]
PQVQQAVDGLLDNLRRSPAPLALLSQYLPDQARALNAGELSADPQEWVLHKVTQVLDDYHAACYPEGR